MKKLTLEYIAGFVDGEGCFTITKTQSDSFWPTFFIGNTNLQILKEIQKYFSLNLKIYTQKQQGSNSKTLYILKSNMRDHCKSIATQLEPYLRLKKEQAQIIMQYPRADPTQRGPGTYGDLSTKAFVQKLYNRMKDLNKRGISTQEANEDLQPEPDPQLNLLDLNQKEVI